VLDAESLTQRPRFAEHSRETFDAALWACFEIFAAGQIQRRPRGASRAALAPTVISSLLILGVLRANALAHGAI